MTIKNAEDIEFAEVKRKSNGQFDKGNIPKNKTHGMYGTRFYFKYFSMKQMQSITAWAKEKGIRKELIAARISRGWPIANALSTKKFHRYKSGLTI